MTQGRRKPPIAVFGISTSNSPVLPASHLETPPRSIVALEEVEENREKDNMEVDEEDQEYSDTEVDTPPTPPNHNQVPVNDQPPAVHTRPQRNIIID